MGTARYSVVFQLSLQAGEMSCTHRGLRNVILVDFGLGNDTARGKLVERENQEDQAFITAHQPQPVVIIGTIVFIHESNKAESVLKAFTVRFRAHE